MSILSVNELSFSYRGKYATVHAVSELSYQFQRGKFYAVIGKSGSGKTTLLSLLAGLERPTQGQVLFNGVSTTDMNCDEYRRDSAAVIYQSFNLFPLLTVEENVMYPLRLKKIPKPEAAARAHEELRKMGLGEALFRRRPGQLSGGEQQRVAIARALASGSEVILADEPTGNLDESNTENIIAILLDIAHNQDRCVITVTHDMSIADKADHVLRLRDGRLME